jgi:hypothetical protein
MKQNEPTCTVLTNGNKIWLVNGIVHRLDGPAIGWKDETRE